VRSTGDSAGGEHGQRRRAQATFVPFWLLALSMIRPLPPAWKLLRYIPKYMPWLVGIFFVMLVVDWRFC